MVSLDTYRARIGLFNRAGKSRSSPGKTFDFSILQEYFHEQATFKPLNINRKASYSFLVIFLTTVLLNPACGRKQIWNDVSASSNLLGKQEHFHKSDTILEASVLADKLIIGNVESNPGPMDIKEFLAFLFVDAEDEEICRADILSLYFVIKYSCCM